MVMLVSIELVETITLGSLIVGLLVGAAGLATYFYGVKWKTAAMVNEANAKAWEETARRLTEEVTVLREKVATLESQVQDLRKHDMEHVLSSLSTHEAQAAVRHKTTLQVLEDIRDSLKGALNAGGS